MTASGAKPALPAEQLCLLVVDDDAMMFPLLKRFAEPLGFVVEYRASGREALSCLADLRPTWR
jgi:CheY-like chemotaxis protein